MVGDWVISIHVKSREGRRFSCALAGSRAIGPTGKKKNHCEIGPEGPPRTGVEAMPSSQHQGSEQTIPCQLSEH